MLKCFYIEYKLLIFLHLKKRKKTVQYFQNTRWYILEYTTNNITYILVINWSSLVLVHSMNVILCSSIRFHKTNASPSSCIPCCLFWGTNGLTWVLHRWFEHGHHGGHAALTWIIDRRLSILERDGGRL